MTCRNTTLESVKQRIIAIVGSGPGGLAAAKYLKEHGFELVVFEQADGIGGQWNIHRAGSGVWPRSMSSGYSEVLSSSVLLNHPAISGPSGEH